MNNTKSNTDIQIGMLIVILYFLGFISNKQIKNQYEYK
jgi:hypothetical protein